MTALLPKLSCLAAAALVFGATTVFAQLNESDIFREEDARRFYAFGCSKDSKPIEGKFSIVTSFSDAQRLNKMMDDTVLRRSLGDMWGDILRRLSYKDIFDPERSKTSHDIMGRYVDATEKRVEHETGISLSIYQIESRPMDPLTEPDAPSCNFDL
jgi:hypothetical protein